jgi:sugar lactone lactonase YvrE
MANLQTLKTLEGLGFAESLRWRGEELWFSDMFRGTVIAWNPNVGATVKLSQSDGGPEMPGGLGWTPDGDLLVVDCLKRQVLKLDGNGELSVFADLSGLTEHPLNDMHVDPDGTAWVGGYGFDPESDEPVASALYRISPTGEVNPTPASFVFPNGCERQNGLLAVAETFADRVSFVDDDVRLVKTFASESGAGPDGEPVSDRRQDGVARVHRPESALNADDSVGAPHRVLGQGRQQRPCVGLRPE